VITCLAFSTQAFSQPPPDDNDINAKVTILNPDYSGLPSKVKPTPNTTPPDGVGPK
jgi:hypothetical protein